MLIYVFNRYRSDASGAAAAEYDLLSAGIALAVIVGVGVMGGAVEGVFTEADTGL